MSKVKMRCNTCGKWFQSANAKDITCPDCVQKAKREKTAKSAPPSSNTPMATGTRPAPPPPPKPKPVQSGTNQWLDTLHDVKIGQPEQSVRPKLPPMPPSRDTRGGNEGRGFSSPPSYRDRDERGMGRTSDLGEPGNYRDNRVPRIYDERGSRSYPERRGPGGPGNYREANRGPGSPGTYRPGSPGGSYSGGYSGIPGQRPRQPMEGGFGGRGPRPAGPGEVRYDRPDRQRSGSPASPPRNKAKQGGPRQQTKPSKPPTPPKPKVEKAPKTPPPPPFTITPEQVAKVEERYLELATPNEFDGIRTQIAQELSIPKSTVKKIIKDLRARKGIPSWWELQTYKGNTEELERIKAVYEPMLPLPDIGVHKKIAEQLNLRPATVYQAIKVIRQELSLPQYNDPVLHGLPSEAPSTASQDGAHASEASAVPASATTASEPAHSEEATPSATSVAQEETSA
jgi:hypothetical protein